MCYWTVEKVRLSSAVAKTGLSCVYEVLLYKNWQLLVRMDWKCSRSIAKLGFLTADSKMQRERKDLT